MSEIKIDKGVPLPPKSGGRNGSKWPWKKMKTGDSFFAAGYAVQDSGGKIPEGFKHFNGSNGRDFIPGSSWSVRTVTENGVRGVRVWRVK